MNVVTAFLLLLAISALPNGAFAQGCEHTDADADSSYEAVRTFFTDPGLPESRGPNVSVISGSDTVYVVRTDSVCAAVLDVVLTFVRSRNSDWASGAVGNYIANIFRAGPYYLVRLAPERVPLPPNTAKSSYSPYLILRASDLTILRSANI
jgi:hypothetical protein